MGSKRGMYSRFLKLISHDCSVGHRGLRPGLVVNACLHSLYLGRQRSRFGRADKRLILTAAGVRKRESPDKSAYSTPLEPLGIEHSHPFWGSGRPHSERVGQVRVVFSLHIACSLIEFSFAAPVGPHIIDRRLARG